MGMSEQNDVLLFALLLISPTLKTVQAFLASKCRDDPPLSFVMVVLLCSTGIGARVLAAWEDLAPEPFWIRLIRYLRRI